MKTVLLLAGTAEARQLATAYCALASHEVATSGTIFQQDAPPVRLIASLAGVTAKPLAYSCETRRGGFDGVGGLHAYLKRERIAAVIDATHPFAVGMSRNAMDACDALGVPLLTLMRQAWEPIGDWHSFATLEKAIAALPLGARVLATTGRKHIDPYIARDDLYVFLRSVDGPDALPAHIVPIAVRGPFTVHAETALMKEHHITHLLTRNAGGESRARLDAAASFGLPIHVVERPPQLAATVVHTVADALHWLDDVLRD